MKPKCPKCNSPFSRVSKNGYFYRKSDSKKVQKYKCTCCNHNFSKATFSPCYYQKKRKLNFTIGALLCSCVSQRRLAIILNTTRKTIARKLDFLGEQAALKHEKWLEQKKGSFTQLQLDDLESFEITKLKPLTVSMVVESESRKIVDFKVSQIGPKGLLVEKANRLYGKRANTSYKAREELFEKLTDYIDSRALFKTDEHHHYKPLISKYFPQALHFQYKSVRGSLVGQGELKRIAFDPLFSINHTFAMLRDNLKRLSRKSWCTTKKMENLEKHIQLYVEFHNSVLT